MYIMKNLRIKVESEVITSLIGTHTVVQRDILMIGLICSVVVTRLLTDDD